MKSKGVRAKMDRNIKTLSFKSNWGDKVTVNVYEEGLDISVDNELIPLDWSAWERIKSFLEEC